uniref:Reverse transcriptase domain-containing protein n=1 Tax=Tanacetum cinerariifolium TaxID=118510 RepID=A0A6L2MII6_TANCI|nr:reverse transcriptase domain-containing protein [Tanacetum cinerariifolium]
MSIPHNNQGPPPVGPPPPNNNSPSLMVRTNGPPPRSMEELCQPSIHGCGGPIASISIQATDFRLHYHMIQQVQNTWQFHGLPGDDANRHIDKILEVTQHMKQNEVSDDALRLSLFSYSLTHHDTAWYDRLPRNSIHTFDDMMRKFLSKSFPPSMVTKLRNEIMKFRQDPNESLFEAWERYKLSIDQSTREKTFRNISSIESPEVVRQLEMINKNFLDMMRQIQSVKSVNMTCETCGGPHSYTECPAVGGYTQDATNATTRNHNSRGNSYQPQGDHNMLSYRLNNYLGPPGFPPLNVQNNQNYNQRQGNYQAPNNQGIGLNFNQGNNNYQAPNYQAPNYQAQVGPSNELSNYMKINETNMRAMQTQMTNIKMELQNEFKSTIDKRINKIENQNSQIMNILTNLTMERQNLLGLGSLPSNTIANSRGDKKLSLPDLTPTRMTLELATRSIAYPTGIAKDVFVQVGRFTFPAVFIVINYDIDPRVPLILGRPFMRTARALVDAHEEKLILRDSDEQLIFHTDNTSKHPHKHGNESINMINFIDITCEDRFPKVLKFKKSNHPSSGSTTPLSSPSPTPFETSDSFLEEFVDELALLDPFPPGNEDNNFDFEADLREIKFLLNQDSSTESNIKTIDPVLEKITDEPSLDYLPPPRDDDDDLFDLKSVNDEWKNLLYGDFYKDIDFEKDKTKDSKMKLLVVEA